ncbi:Dam family site-specific DNA-(adenine-N6)-methyltransferase [Hydrogenophaga sp. 5NK40-0174]|uniref:DNA adenine methylase n=1 Tax=Hydrogenophaga sp. 5NK40-0174 TaxID=3127649 RepID=UPI0033409B3E
MNNEAAGLLEVVGKRVRQIAEPASSLPRSSNESDLALVPFLKWPGGKRWFVCNHAELLPTEYGTYVEPFLGAGAVYFYLKPTIALLGDVNAELVDAYRVIKDNWQGLDASLHYRHRRHREDPDYYYYWLRAKVPTNLVQRASRLIYLNRTCFNGIYRVNQQGQFNVPRGSKDKVVIESDNFESMSKVLAGAELVAGDFESLIDRSKGGDFVFCDPPYTVRHNYNGFRKYNEVLFSWADQVRLAQALARAALRGVKVVCTNANHQSVRELYQSKIFEQRVVSRYSHISAGNAGRSYFEELVIRANV